MTTVDRLVLKLKDAYEATVGKIEPWQSDAYLEAIAKIQGIEQSTKTGGHWINDYIG